MLRSFIKTLLTLWGFLPGAILTLRGVIETSEKVHFDTQFPHGHEKIVNLVNGLLYIATEYTGLYILFCPFLAFLWALIVAEPKAVSKRRFDERKNSRIGKRR